MSIGDHQTEIDALLREHFPEPALEPHQNGHPTPRGALLEDDEVVRLCRKARNAPTFAALFDDGDLSAHGDDDSRADAALLGILKHRTQDPDQLERLWGASALGRREKFRTRPDYRRRTIDFVLGDDSPKPQDEVRSRSRSLGNKGMRNDPEQSIRAVSLRGREKPGPREWVVERAVCQGHPASWYGESGIAKSLLAAHLGIHIAADGVDYWAGLRVHTVPVIYGDFELDEEEHLRRVQELAAGMGLPDVPAKFHYLPLAGLSAEEAFGVAASECERLRAGLFIVDSVGFALDGDSELAKDVLRFHREYIRPIKDAGATPLLIDHQAKIIKGEKYSDKQEFGSVYKTNAVRSSFQIRGAWEGNELTTTFTHKKTNFGPKVPDFSLRLVFGNASVKVERLAEAVPNPEREPTVRERVQEAAEELGRATAETLARETGLQLKSVQNAMTDLVREGALVDTGEKAARSRIVIPHSHTTQGMGTGMSAETAKPAPESGLWKGTL